MRQRSVIFTLCKYSKILVLIIICVISSYPQIDKSNKNTVVLKQKQEKERFVKEQAVLLLKNSLLNLKNIENFLQKTDVIIEASTTLWDYDKSFAEDSLLNFINQSLADYKELSEKENKTPEENAGLQNLFYALEKSLKLLAGKDLETAKLLQNKFFEIRQQALKGKKLNESLALAAEGLELDEQRTLELLSVILQQGVPSHFPKFIFELREKNPVTAKILTQRAIQNLAVNPNYKASDAIILSVIVFNEPAIITPSLNDETNVNEFFVFTSFTGSPTKPAEIELISAYYRSVQNFFDSRLRNQAGGFFDSPQNLIRSYFLLEKLKSYNRVYRLNNSETLNAISIPVEALMQSAGFSQQTLSDVRGYAERLANSNNPLGLDDGTNLLEKAENAKTPEEKLDYLIRGIIQLIEFKEYVKAERKIFDVENSEIRDALYILLNMRAGLEAIKNKNWSEFEKRTEKISDKQIKAFLYLKAAADYKSAKYSDIQLFEYVIKAEKNIQDISDKNAKAGAVVCLTELLLSSKPTEGLLMLSLAIKSINEAPEFDEDEFEINVKIPTRETYYAEFIGKNSFRRLFSKLAEIDWEDSQVQALQIKSDGLQAIAQVIAAKSVLRKMKLPK